MLLSTYAAITATSTTTTTTTISSQSDSIFVAILFFFFSEEMVGLSVGEKNFIQGGIDQNIRSDGRKRNTYRPLSVETGVIPQV